MDISLALAVALGILIAAAVLGGIWFLIHLWIALLDFNDPSRLR